MLFIEGSRPSGLFCLNSGKIKLTKLGNEGKEKIIRIAGPGDWVGYKSLVTKSPFTATATALQDTTVCFIPGSDFFYLLKSNDEFQTKFTQLLCRNLSEAEEEIVDIAYKSVRERLAESLLLLKHKFGEDRDENNDFVLNITREDLANLVGTAKETIIRLLSDLRAQGIIESKGRKIVLKDQKALVRMSNMFD